MADFYSINRTVNKQDVILYDAMSITGGTELTVNTESTAVKQRIKFFLDAVEYTVGAVTTRRQIGTYIEMEDGQMVTPIMINNTYTINHNQGTYSFAYPTDNFSFYFNCSNGNSGQYVLSFSNATNNFTLYISSVIICDSYYTSARGWLNPDNPDNILNSFTPKVNTSVDTSYIPPVTQTAVNTGAALVDDVSRETKEVKTLAGIFQAKFRNRRKNSKQK